MADEKPDYKVYRSRPRLPGRRDEGSGAGLRELRRPERRRRATRGRRTQPAPGRRLRLPRLRGAAAPPPRPRAASPSAASCAGLLLGVLAWVTLSAVLFMVSAQLQRGDLARRVGAELDARPLPAVRREHDPRARLRRAHGGARGAGGHGRRAVAVGLDHAAAHRRRRQRVAVHPARHGGRHPGQRTNKINAAYAIGGARLAMRTVEAVPRRRGQPRRRGELRELPPARSTPSAASPSARAASSPASTAARATAATRCACAAGSTSWTASRRSRSRARARTTAAPREDDRTRARRQQQIVAAMKDKVTLVRDVRAAAVGLVGRAARGAHRHERADAARRRRRRRSSAASRDPDRAARPPAGSRWPTAAPA